MNIYFIIISIVMTAIMTGVFLYLFNITRKIQDFENNIKAFITPVDDKTASPLAQTWQSISEVFARSIMAQGKGFLMGLQSGEKRGETAVQADMKLDTAPAQLGSLLTSFPSLKRSLRKNPQLIDIAMSLLSRSGGGNGSQPANNSSAGPKFKL